MTTLRPSIRICRAQEAGSRLGRGASQVWGWISKSRVVTLELHMLGFTKVLWGIQILILSSWLGNHREDFGPLEVTLPTQFPP